MIGSIALKSHEWDDVKAAMLARMREHNIPAEKLVAVQIEWPEGVRGVRTIQPSCIKLVVQGLRLQGFTVPSWCIQRVEGVTAYGLPLHMIYPQNPVHEMSEEYVRERVRVHGMSPVVSTGRVVR